MSRTLASFGVELDASPAIEAAGKIKDALSRVGEGAKQFASAFREASSNAGRSARESADAVSNAATRSKRSTEEASRGFEEMGARAGAAYRRTANSLRNTLEETFDSIKRASASAFSAAGDMASRAFSGAWEWIQKTASALTGTLSESIGTTIPKISALAAEIALTARGLGLLSIPVLAAGHAFGGLGTVAASSAAIWFTYSASAAGARVALQGMLEAAGLSHVALDLLKAGARSFGVSLSGVVTTIVGAILVYKTLAAAIDSVAVAQERQSQIAQFARVTGNPGDAAARTSAVSFAAVGVPGLGAAEAQKLAAEFEKVNKVALLSATSLEAIGGMAIQTGKDFGQLAGMVTKLYAAIQFGQTEETSKLIKQFQEMGVFGDAAEAAIARLQATGASGATVWQEARQAFAAYTGLVRERQTSWGAAMEAMGKAWTELKIALGTPVVVAMTPILETLASLVRDVFVPAIKLAVGVLGEISDVLGRIPVDTLTKALAPGVAFIREEVIPRVKELIGVLQFFGFSGSRTGGGGGGWMGAEVRVPYALPTVTTTTPGPAGLNTQHSGGSLPGFNDAFNMKTTDEIREGLEALRKLGRDKDDDNKSSSRGGSGSGTKYETDAGLVAKYREEIESLSKALEAGSVSQVEFTQRQANLQESLARSLGDPTRYADDVGAFRAAQQEKLRILEATKQSIESGNASLLETLSYGLQKALQESGKITKQIASALPNLITGTADAFGSAFSSIVTGSKSAGDAFRDFASGVLADIAKLIGRLLFLQLVESTLGVFGIGAKGIGTGAAGLSSGLSGIIGSGPSVLGGDWSGLGVAIGAKGVAIGARPAGGGDVSVGDIYVNVQSDGSASVQTDASGGAARKLAQTIKLAVQTGIQQELRPGGLLRQNTAAA